MAMLTPRAIRLPGTERKEAGAAKMAGREVEAVVGAEAVVVGGERGEALERTAVRGAGDEVAEEGIPRRPHQLRRLGRRWGAQRFPPKPELHDKRMQSAPAPPAAVANAKARPEKWKAGVVGATTRVVMAVVGVDGSKRPKLALAVGLSRTRQTAAQTGEILQVAAAGGVQAMELAVLGMDGIRRRRPASAGGRPRLNSTGGQS